VAYFNFNSELQLEKPCCDPRRGFFLPDPLRLGVFARISLLGTPSRQDRQVRRVSRVSGQQRTKNQEQPLTYKKTTCNPLEILNITKNKQKILFLHCNHTKGGYAEGC
jgi:hypothetical protein